MPGVQEGVRRGSGGGQEVLICNFIVVNLFIAILLSSFDAHRKLEVSIEDRRGLGGSQEGVRRCSSASSSWSTSSSPSCCRPSTLTANSR
jgi:hypothetical protein